MQNKMLNHITLFIFITAIMLASDSFGQQPSLEIKISNVRMNDGNIVVAIFKEKSNWLKTPFREKQLSASDGTKTASFQVPYGKYAISVYQDVNENGELDRTFIGIPKEPIAFGNDHKPFGKPKFKSALIEHKSSSKTVEVTLYEAF